VENMQYKFEPIEQFIYCTQLLQAECLASAYRLWKRQWRGPGKEYCAGALVWQLNDCWPVTSWAIVDYYLRPKHAYYAIKRELAPITIGLKRTKITIPADKYTRVYIKTVHKIEMWATNLSLDRRTVDVQAKSWDIVTGKLTHCKIIHKGLVLEPNRSTEAAEFEIPVEKKNTGEEGRTVVATYLIENGVQVARYVNWPEPLKYAPLQKPQKLEVKVSDDAKAIEISAEVPVKGVAVEAKDEEVVFADNCIDVVPGETVKIGVQGLKEGDDGMIGVRYLGL